MNLDATTKSLEVKLGGAVTTNQLTWVTHYADINQSTIAITAVSENDGVTNGATAVTIVAAPGASTTRQIKQLTVENTDTVTQTVTISLNDNGTKQPVVVVAIAPASTLVFSGAWSIIPTPGALAIPVLVSQGGTGADLSGTGGAHQVLQQSSVGAAITVGQLAASDLSNGVTGSGAVVLATSPALLTSPTAPTQTSTDNSTKLATTAFVSTAITNAIAAVNPAVAVQAASADVLPNSPTYSNGVAGIGATLTAGSTNVTLVVDGYTPVLSDRILVKTQASAFQNGVYTVTVLAGVAVAWVLTRALDYDQPSDMNNTGAIPVVNGTANAQTQWVLTSTVNTVGTDAVTFTQFSLNPTTLLADYLQLQVWA